MEELRFGDIKKMKRFIIEDRGHYCHWNMQEVKARNQRTA